MINRTNIKNSLLTTKQQITWYEQLYHRSPGAVHLIAASKAQDQATIEHAINAGQMDFGENYLQEALFKISKIKNSDIIWHFIGKIQSNKVKLIAEHFNWVHTVDRFKIAHLLNQHRAHTLPPLNICIQVNISNEATKSGVKIEEAEQLCYAVKSMQSLKLRGLMSLPEKNLGSFSHQRKPFQQLKQLFDKLNDKGFAMDTLSMGMSGDYEAAIAEGATMIRIGSAIFGERKR